MRFALIALACTATCAPLAGIAGDIYRNDFSTRTSEGAIPTANWHELAYSSGLLANTNGSKPYAESEKHFQDGWAKAQNNCGADAYVYTTNDNNVVVLGYDRTTGSADHIIVKQRIGNVFTSGVVTVQFDFMPPASWASYSATERRCFLSVGDERYYSPEVDQGDTIFNYTAANVGIVLTNGARKVWYKAATRTTTDAEVTKGAWLRAVLTIDLDARTWGYSIYELGAFPAFATPTPATPVHSESGLDLADASIASISSISLAAYGVAWNANNSKSGAPTHSAFFDNIRISHDGVECYTNTFTKRRYLRLDAGTTSGTYVADCVVTNSVGSPIYAQDVKIIPPEVKNGKDIEPVGVDGWRRLVPKDYASKSDMKIYADNNLCLRVSQDTVSYAGAAHPIGTTLRSGKVRMQVDMRVPSEWKKDGSHNADAAIWVSLGNDRLYNGVKIDCHNGRFAHVGIHSLTNNPRYLQGSTGISGPTNTIKMATWYRVCITADMNAKTYDYTLYEQGSSHPNADDPNGTEVFSVTNVQRTRNIDEITCFALWGYLAIAYFDNVLIWHTPTGGTTETLLYRNVFQTRATYHQDKREGLLCGTLALNPEGQDFWRNIYPYESARITDDADPALTFVGNDNTYYAQEIGQTVADGELVAQVDIRPPRGWRAEDGSVYLRLGSDIFYQGNVVSSKPTQNFLNSVASGVGFKNIGSAREVNNGVNGLYTNVTVVAYSGNGTGGGSMVEPTSGGRIDPSHWYRFVVTAKMKNSRYDVAVYDMGTAHPTLATPTPADPVKTFANIQFRYDNETLGGVSCVSVSSIRALYSTYDDSTNAYVDNIRIAYRPSGMMLIVR